MGGGNIVKFRKLLIVLLCLFVLLSCIGVSFAANSDNISSTNSNSSTDVLVYNSSNVLYSNDSVDYDSGNVSVSNDSNSRSADNLISIILIIIRF